MIIKKSGKKQSDRMSEKGVHQSKKRVRLLLLKSEKELKYI